MTSVVVVGGGIAGLACAWRLSGLPGFEVEVLESEASVGGRMRSEEHDGFILDRGVPTLGSGQTQIHGLVRRLGLAASMQRLREPSLAILDGARFEPQSLAGIRGLAATSRLSFGSRLRLMRLSGELRRHRGVLDPNRPEAAVELDELSLGQVLNQWAGTEAGQELVLPLLAARYGADVDRSTQAFLLMALKWAEDNPHDDYVEGGLGRICDALADGLRVRQGCRVEAIENHTGGVRIRYRVGEREGNVVSDAAVVAVPGPRVAGLCSKLTPIERGFFESVRYSQSLVAHALYERSPGKLPVQIAVPRGRGFAISSIHAAHLKLGAAPTGAGLLSVSMTGDAAVRHWDLANAELGALLRDELERTPLGGHTPRQIVVHRWPEHLPQFYPGYLRRLQAFQRRADRSPRLAFCGDYLLGPWCDAALASGMRAASDLVHQLEDH